MNTNVVDDQHLRPHWFDVGADDDGHPRVRRSRGFYLLFVSMVGLVVPFVGPLAVMLMGMKDRAAMRAGTMDTTTRTQTLLAIAVGALAFVGQAASLFWIAKQTGGNSELVLEDSYTCGRAIQCCASLHGMESTQCNGVKELGGLYTGQPTGPGRDEARAQCETALRNLRTEATASGTMPNACSARSGE